MQTDMVDSTREVPKPLTQVEKEVLRAHELTAGIVASLREISKLTHLRRPLQLRRADAESACYELAMQLDDEIEILNGNDI